MLRSTSGPASAQSFLGQAIVTPSPVKAGQTFLLEVKMPNGSSYPDDYDGISIGGLLTPRRYMSFRNPGQRAVVIGARQADGAYETARVAIEVLPSAEKLPSLEIEPSLQDGARVRFRVEWPEKHSHTNDRRFGKRRQALSAVIAKRFQRVRKADELSRREQSELAASAHAFVTQAAEKAAREAAAQFVATAAQAAVSRAARIAGTSGGTRLDPEKAAAAAASAAASAVLASADVTFAHVPPNGDNDLTTTTYSWDFGTGPFVSSTFPSITHDFEARLDPARPRTVFLVKVDIHEPGKAPFELRRTIEIVNPYHPSRVTGVIRPIVSNDFNAALVMDTPRHYRASFTVTNLEHEAITLTQHRFEPLYLGDPPSGPAVRIEHSTISDILRTYLDRAQPSSRRNRSATASRFFTSRPLAVGSVTLDVDGDWIAQLVAGHPATIPADGIQEIEVRLPSAALPAHAVGFAVHYRGVSATGKQVRASAYFDVPGRFPRLETLDTSIAATLKTLIDSGLLPTRQPVFAGDILTLATRSTVTVPLGRGALQRALSPWTSGDRSGPMQPLSGEADIFEGLPCDPYYLPSVIPEGWVCQATSQQEWRWVPPRFVNARQGDIILSPGGDGLIAQLLRQVDPPQHYSHSGIMTRNQTEVTHSTAAETRLYEYLNGSGLDGFQPNALRFLWPGVIKQMVEHAVDGQSMTDPQASDQTYTVSGFNPDFSAATSAVVPALVVKPDPFEETTEIRSKLREIGAFASEQHGKGHYRFFGYTDPTVVLGPTAPQSAGWAAGTYPCVCSSFVWFCARTNQVTFEGPSLEPDDLAPDVTVDAPESGEDGLYLYTATERLAAGEFIYQWLYDEVWETVEGFEEVIAAIDDAADDLANQVLNTFESDWAETDAKDSEQWRSPSNADAVSPDNILRWDGPSKGGFWGSSEPLIYRTARYEYVPKHVWKKIDKVGTLHGTVLFDGQSVDGATIELSGGQFAAFSGGDGTFSFVAVPAGLYQLTAYKVVDDQGTLQATLVPIDVEILEGEQDIVVQLSGPNPDYREIAYEIALHVKDYEFAAAADPHEHEYYDGVAHLGPDDPYIELGPFACLCDQDVLAEGFLDLEWKPDRTVRYRRRLRLHDGESPSDPSWNHASTWKTLAPGQEKSGWISLGDFNDSEDAAEMSTTLKNDVDMS